MSYSRIENTAVCIFSYKVKFCALWATVSNSRALDIPEVYSTMSPSSADADCDISVALIKSIIDSAIVGDEHWDLAVVSEGIHGFLIFERSTVVNNEIIKYWYRADLRPQNAVKSIGIGTTAEITFEETTEEAYNSLVTSDNRCFIVDDVTPEKAKRVLKRIQDDIEKKEQTYFLPGDGTSVVLTRGQDSNFNNCISYCQKIIEKELGTKIGNKRSLVKIPPSIVSRASKAKRNDTACCELC